MTKSSHRAFVGSVVLALILGASGVVRADEVIAVLSSNLRPYQEILAGLEQALGHPVRVVALSDHKVSIPSETQVIVAIGGEAALQDYPRDVALVYCLAPGILLPSSERKAPTAKIYMTPEASVVMNRLKALQPDLKNLGILGLTESRDEFNSQMQQVGAPLGVQVLVEKLRNPNEIPDRLRGLQPRINALWIPPDPRLITRQNFILIKEFCLANRIAFYVPTVELVEQGATASVAVSFDQMGLTAGRVVKEFLVGTTHGGKIYPEKSRIAINLKAAAEIGLKISPEQQEKADKVIP